MDNGERGLKGSFTNRNKVKEIGSHFRNMAVKREEDRQLQFYKIQKVIDIFAINHPRREGRSHNRITSATGVFRETFVGRRKLADGCSVSSPLRPMATCSMAPPPLERRE